MSTRFPDPIAEGLNRGWRVHGHQGQPLPAQIDCDVAIVGSGAGGGITAEMLARAGLNVVIIEEGPLKSSQDFRQRESEAYPQLYQESAARKTADQSINILQGRCVGGSTTVNWTSSFRTPDITLAYWRDHFGLSDWRPEDMAPWFAAVERRLNIRPWLVPPNVNNELLRTGANQLGIQAESILRNVKGCWNLGSCGMGCPTNAKQSMLVTTIPTALDHGATLLVQTRAHQLVLKNGEAQALNCLPVGPDSAPLGHAPCVVRARHYVLAGGAINTPALLMRSDAPDPHERLGRRTFLHPVVLSTAQFEQRVEGWQGAPQTIYTDHFLHTEAIDGPMGFKLEAPPMHPLIYALTLPGMGQVQADLLRQFPHTHTLLALLRDGFHPEAPGGRVTVRRDGSPLLDYPLTDFVMAGGRRALLHMAEIQFAAGAKSVMPVHEMAAPATTWPQAKAMIDALPMKPLLTRFVSAHVMGGCGMAGQAHMGVVNPEGRHWQLGNVSVHDGSVFPTSIGANPQVSVYGHAARFTTALADQVFGKRASLAEPA